MFPFKKTPSRVEIAKRTVSSAAEKLSERAHDLIDHAPAELHLAEAKEKLSALKSGVAAGLVGAGSDIAEKVATVRDHAREEVPDLHRARKQAQAQIDSMQRQAQQYKRELEKELAHERERFETEKARLVQEARDLKSRVQQRADEINENEDDAIAIPVAPADESVAYDEDYDETGGTNAWLWIGGILLASAGVVYYLFSTTSGKRSKAVIQDRVVQVKEGVREAVVQNSDATGEPATEEIAEAATEAFDRSNEKIGAPIGNEGLPDKAVEKLGEVGDKVADGIESVGDFIADKLEAAGAGAHNVAHSAAEKLDDAKDNAVSRVQSLATEPPDATSGATAPPDAVIVELVTDEPPRGETTDEILAEVEETVNNIEQSAKRSKR